ncbi:hypothetical protein [Synechococcus sp. RedBA-s]|uniref:hypothetical protein n=1 Tax=Synechococcus sp. RedBA-s TaxID=2823741 RepID=UPI0020CDD04E|nr:hypothetical protein [Synechococcus sp. RedBA-s]MCP9800144.1 hypothetical protein [Synechococcus sp. RedBA-s]
MSEDPTPALSVEINALSRVDDGIVDYTVKPRAQVAGQQLRNLALPNGVLVTLILRSRLQPWIDRLVDPDPDEASLPVGLVLAFNAAASFEQLHRLFGVAIPAEIGPDAAAQSLAELLANTEAVSEVHVGSFGLRAGADQDLLTACCLAETPLQ